MVEEASLYIHVPFCRKKCSYCHFYVIPDHPDKQLQLYETLLKEWEYYRPLFQQKKLVSIYFGGGTPILWDVKYIQGFLEKINAEAILAPNIEITLEANPEEVTPALIKKLLEIGINRFSVGIQSHDDQLLQLLGRGHGGNKALHSVEVIAQAGGKNISVDVMYDIPEQNLAKWQRTLTHVADLPVTHISLYNLTIEPHTLFFKNRQKLEPLLPSQEDSVQMFQLAQSHFKEKGFSQYEISAFAKPGYASVHNSGYWTGRPFIGLGPSAFSFWEGRRFRNIAHLEKYAKSVGAAVDFEETLAPEQALREYLAIRLRLLEGFVLPSNLPAAIEHDLAKIEQLGWIFREGNRIRLTEDGVLFYDSVAVELI